MDTRGQYFRATETTIKEYFDLIFTAFIGLVSSTKKQVVWNSRKLSTNIIRTFCSMTSAFFWWMEMVPSSWKTNNEKKSNNKWIKTQFYLYDPFAHFTSWTRTLNAITSRPMCVWMDISVCKNMCSLMVNK